MNFEPTLFVSWPSIYRKLGCLVVTNDTSCTSPLLPAPRRLRWTAFPSIKKPMGPNVANWTVFIVLIMTCPLFIPKQTRNHGDERHSNGFICSFPTTL